MARLTLVACVASARVRLVAAALVAAGSMAALSQPASACPPHHFGGLGGFGGYGGYNHSYYTQPTYAYAQPAYYATAQQVAPVAVAASVATTVPPATSTVQALVGDAKSYFKQRQFEAAISSLNTAVSMATADQMSELLQFRSLVYFAKGDVQHSSADAYAGLAAGSSLNWTAIAALYPSTEEYARQYHLLAQAAQVKANDASIQFLLGYHHLMLGHVAEGRAALVAAQQSLPNDRLLPALIAQLPAPAVSVSAIPVAPVSSPFAASAQQAPVVQTAAYAPTVVIPAVTASSSPLFATSGMPAAMSVLPAVPLMAPTTAEIPPSPTFGLARN